MALLLTLTKLTPEATKGLLRVGPVAREQYLRETVTKLGGTLVNVYFTEGGDFDIMAIVELPDDLANLPGFSIAQMLATQAAGLYASWRAIRLYTPADVQTALAKAVALTLPGAHA